VIFGHTQEEATKGRRRCGASISSQNHSNALAVAEH